MKLCVVRPFVTDIFIRIRCCLRFLGHTFSVVVVAVRCQDMSIASFLLMGREGSLCSVPVDGLVGSLASA